MFFPQEVAVAKHKNHLKNFTINWQKKEHIQLLLFHSLDTTHFFLLTKKHF